MAIGKRISHIKRFRQGIYSVAEARKQAVEKLKVIESGGEINVQKYLFKNLYEAFITQKRKKGQAESTIKSARSLCEAHLLPHFGNMDAREVKYSKILAVFNGIFNESDVKSPRLETIKKAKIALRAILAPALKDRYIEYDPTIGLEKEFPNLKRFNIEHDIDSRLAALTKESDIQEFLQDLGAVDMDVQVKRALYLQILCVNHPANTAAAKWAHIDLESKLWSIPAKEMKMRESLILLLAPMLYKYSKPSKQILESCKALLYFLQSAKMGIFIEIY